MTGSPSILTAPRRLALALAVVLVALPKLIGLLRGKRRAPVAVGARPGEDEGLL